LAGEFNIKAEHKCWKLMSTEFNKTYGPWAIVTGASSGIGRAFAEVLAEKSVNLVIVARRKERLESLAASLAEKHNVQVVSLELDLNAADFIKNLGDATDDLDIGLVVSNAGFGFKGPHHEQNLGELDKLLNVNARAPMLIARAYAPGLIRRGKGGIIITGSMEGVMGFPWSGAYAASKAYVRALGEALWGELAEHGVDVLVLSPGATDTENLRSQGYDPDKMPGIMTPRTVATLALENIRRGPQYIPGFRNAMTVRILSMLPRRLALKMAAKGIKASLEK